MTQPTTAKTLEIHRVRPFPDSLHSDSATELCLPLTFFDVIWLRFHPIERLFFYRVNGLNRSHFESLVLPRLRASLSLTLLHFRPLAGRLLWDPRESKPHISYAPNDAISLIVAESDSDMDRLSSDGPRQAVLLSPLVPELEISDRSSPILALQVTLFPNQGFCIGRTIHHAVLDGKTINIFFEAWANVCRTEMTGPCPLPAELTPSFDRSPIKDPTGLAAKIMNTWMSADPRKSLRLLADVVVKPELLRATFKLTPEHINRLRSRAKNESRDPSKLRLSTFVLVYAHVTTCLVKARGGDRQRPVAITFTADYRSRSDPPLPPTYLGNCVGGDGNFDSRAGEFMDNDGFAVAVKKISDMVSGLDAKAVKKIPEISKSLAGLEPGTQLVTVAGSNRFGVYGSDFGWGRPEKVDIVSIDKNLAVSIDESRDESGGGVEIGVCLEGREELESFTSLFWEGLQDA